MARHAGRSSISVSGSNDLIPGADPQYAENQLHARRRRVQAHRLFRLAAHRNQVFKLFGAGARRNPPERRASGNFGNLRLRHIGRRKGDMFHIFNSFY